MRITLNIAPKPFSGGYLWIATFPGQEHSGPFGIGDNPTEAINSLLDAAIEDDKQAHKENA